MRFSLDLAARGFIVLDQERHTSLAAGTLGAADGGWHGWGISSVHRNGERAAPAQSGAIEASGAASESRFEAIDTTDTWFADGTPVIQTEHNLDPWVINAGVGCRF